MTEQEINRTIAELLGYTCEARAMNADYETYILTPDNMRLEYTVAWYAPQDGSVSWAMLFDDDVRIEGFRDNEVVPPLWATDTNAALALYDDLDEVETMKLERHATTDESHQMVWVWTCQVDKAGGKVSSSTSSTAARALCMAFVARDMVYRIRQDHSHD